MLSYLLILNIIFFSGFNTIQINAEELEKESNSIDEELIPEQQDETETSDTNGNMETDTDTVLETDLSQPLEQKNPADGSEQSGENSNEEHVFEENKPIDLKWDPNKPGSFSFKRNNTEGTDVIVYLYKDGVRQFGQTSGGFTLDNICKGDFSKDIEESGDYTFR